MTLTFPCRRAPALLALATTAILALLLWRIARQTPLHGGHLAFCALLLAYSGYAALRESRYLIRPETLRLDTRGLALRHHRAPGWRALRLPWTELIDQETHGDRITLIWRDGDRLRAFTLRLPAQPRSAEIAATIARYPPRPVPWPPVAIPAGLQQHWDTGEPGIRTALHQYGIETLYSPLILTILLIAVPLLDGDYGAISATLAALLLARAAWRRYRTPQHYRIALRKPYIRLDADGVHYWHAPPDDETHVPWAAIHAGTPRPMTKHTSRGRPSTPSTANTSSHTTNTAAICTSPGDRTPTRATCAMTACASPCPNRKTATTRPAHAATKLPPASRHTAPPSANTRPCPSSNAITGYDRPPLSRCRR